MALVQIVQWDKGLDATNTFAWRYVDAKNPAKSDELGNWTQLVVNESQEAILFRDGQACDLLGPGRYTLSTDNIPILRRLINLPTGGESAFKASIWFINKMDVLDVKWGTQTPIQLRDPEFEVVLPVRAYGQFGIRITDSRKFLIKLVGNRSQLTRDDIVNSFRGLILSHMGDLIGTYITQKKITLFDISAYLSDMSNEAVNLVGPIFDDYGIKPVNFYFGSINVPEDDESVRELKKAMNERARMKLQGYSYQQRRSFDVAEAAAKNEGNSGNMMGAGMGLGAGMAMGGAMGGAFTQMGQAFNFGGVPGQASAVPCPKCGQVCPAGAKFCQSCGASLEAPAPVAPAGNMRPCPKCGNPCPANGKFCPSCGAPLTCSCGAEIQPGMKFCAACGKQL